MRRRGAGGVGAIHKQQLAQSRFKDKGSEIADDQLQQMTKQMDAFRSNLQEFASKYKKSIRKNPEFRKQFQVMCASAGVDPLASSKGFWANMLGVGDFYYELGVQIIEVCLATRHRNGGILPLEDLLKLVTKSRSVAGRQEDIQLDDVMRAVDKLKVLGEGFRIISTKSGQIVQSVPTELSADHTSVIQQASDSGFVTVSVLMSAYKWEKVRAERAVFELVREGLVWVDEQFESESAFWFPGLHKYLFAL